MCGIAGILNLRDRQRQSQAIRAMTDRIVHRGPDAGGLYIDDDIALGHRRLSIIDLSEASNQPLWDTTRRYVIVYNGELYNYKEVKQQLDGYPFHTESDTEVILAAYATWGVKCLDHFNGMFAFAIWDTREKRLFAARDRLGKKPFYYHITDDRFVFSSEVRSMLASELIPRELDPDHLTEYLMYQAAQGPNTVVRGVHRLQAGHYMIIQHGEMTEKSFWGYEGIEAVDHDYETAKTHVRTLFLDAVRLRMIADVPVGAFLSGGIDSSLVVACMAEHAEMPVNTFTVSFDEKAYDESVYAKKIATLYNTRHHHITVRPAAFLDSMEDILAAMDTPSGDGPNTYLVSRHVRDAGIKVALSGLGGDELFAGYNKFLMYDRLMKLSWLQHLPVAVRKAAYKGLSGLFPVSQRKKIGAIAGQKKWDLSTLYPVLRQAFGLADLPGLVTHPGREDEVEKRLADILPGISNFGHLSQATVGEIETYTRDVLLRDTDQMSMAHGLEVRVPFFDYRLVAYTLSLSDKVKYPHSPKKLLVDAMHPRLPVEISQRKKMGFTLPFDQWLKNELSPMVDVKLSYLAGRKEFHADALIDKWRTFKNGNGSVPWPHIWKLVVLADWLERNGM